VKLVLGCWLALGCCLSAAVQPAAAQRVKGAPADLKVELKRQLMKKLRGGKDSYFTLALVTTESDVDTVNGVLGFAALSLELLFSPLTIAEGAQGNPDIRPGMLVEKAPAVKPTTHSYEVEIVIVQGKEPAIEAILEHLTGPAKKDGKVRGWTLVKQSNYRKPAIDSADKVESKLEEAARKADIKITRKPDPA
jgi:hypothetical protein